MKKSWIVSKSNTMITLTPRSDRPSVVWRTGMIPVMEARRLREAWRTWKRGGVPDVSTRQLMRAYELFITAAHGQPATDEEIEALALYASEHVPPAFARKMRVVPGSYPYPRDTVYVAAAAFEACISTPLQPGVVPRYGSTVPCLARDCRDRFIQFAADVKQMAVTMRLHGEADEALPKRHARPAG